MTIFSYMLELVGIWMYTAFSHIRASLRVLFFYYGAHKMKAYRVKKMEIENTTNSAALICERWFGIRQRCRKKKCENDQMRIRLYY